MSSVAFIPIILGIVGLIGAFGIYRAVLRYSPGSGKVSEIGEMIHRAPWFLFAASILTWRSLWLWSPC
ncbi:MAG: hypothetical protein CM1200mP20_10200 [Pseudomonadota bacterium]|nr:MAG: hypothetical protein CM1200mP20_10200 [Pseudomonadota bacterium]